MSVLLDKLIDKEGNIYEMTCVAIKEANVIQEKVVTHVLDQVLNDEIKYTTDEKK